MGVYDIVKELAKSKRVSIAEVERKLDLSNGSLSKWNTSMPNSDPLAKVAEYFNVSTDYLLGLTDNPIRMSSATEDFPNDYSEEYFAIQRKASQLSIDDQKFLLEIMNRTFRDIANGDFEDDYDEDL